MNMFYTFFTEIVFDYMILKSTHILCKLSFDLIFSKEKNDIIW